MTLDLIAANIISFGFMEAADKQRTWPMDMDDKVLDFIISCWSYGDLTLETYAAINFLHTMICGWPYNDSLSNVKPR